MPGLLNNSNELFKLSDLIMPAYLTEKKLGLILSEIFPAFEFIHDKSVPGSANNRWRPDYRCEINKLIVEFDGDSHYCKAARIISDNTKDAEFINLGYKIVRIPYFIQITSDVLRHIFNLNKPFTQQYPNGFIDPAAILPADFCELGVKKFLEDLEIFSFHKNEIIASLIQKVKEKKDVNLVMPPSIQYLVK